jgi:hypothetical protein
MAGARNAGPWREMSSRNAMEAAAFKNSDIVNGVRKDLCQTFIPSKVLLALWIA